MAHLLSCPEGKDPHVQLVNNPQNIQVSNPGQVTQHETYSQRNGEFWPRIVLG